MEQINISVVLTVYNGEKYLDECINSIINQTLRNIEIIIINDGSTDGSLEIINKFANTDSRIKILNQKNMGAAKARNNGIKVSNGKYLSILDGDDIFDDNMLESMYLQAEENEADVLICPYRNFNDNKEFRRGLTLPNNIDNLELFSSSDIKEQLFQISNPAAWNKLFNRDFIIKNNISFQSLSSCNDLYFTYFALSLANKISILNKSFVIYRNESSCAISRSRGKVFFNIFKAMNKLKKSLIANNLYDKYSLSYFRRALVNLMYESKSIENKKDIIDFIKSSNKFLENIIKS
ncbi:glycosyltransferase family 2 protein [Aliarcobacter skirrowii]|uniref:glycosyltransferase family 2 protein n=1 Tax=Aliarcobacter skirrowii TaxID=28200 RepID=UPI0029A1390A|nr:glycosyltransferase family 2 protein [Aliarcobacter skirrowii]MDX4013217.1 glycosyltransferase family 2 protein [Aliarcobacter skirrowii]